MNRTLKGLSILLLIAIISASYWMPWELGQPGPRLEPPSFDNWLGTDRLGRDVAFRTVAGLAITLGHAVAILLGAIAIGVPIAIFSIRTHGKTIDKNIALVAEVIRSFPFLVLLLLCLTLKLPGLPVFLLYYWIPVWRLARGAMAPQRNKPYMLSAYLFGIPKTRCIVTELMPNAWPSLAKNLPSVLSDIVAVLAALEFLGIGSEIGQPSLGGMLLDSIQLGFSAPWSWLPSLIVLILVILGLTITSVALQRRQAWTPLG